MTDSDRFTGRRTDALGPGSPTLPHLIADLGAAMALGAYGAAAALARSRTRPPGPRQRRHGGRR